MAVSALKNVSQCSTKNEEGVSEGEEDEYYDIMSTACATTGLKKDFAVISYTSSTGR